MSQLLPESPTRVNLDAVERHLATVKAWDGALVNADQIVADIPALIAELRAAREVIEVARLGAAAKGINPGGNRIQRLIEAVNAYDQAVMS